MSTKTGVAPTATQAAAAYMPALATMMISSPDAQSTRIASSRASVPLATPTHPLTPQ